MSPLSLSIDLARARQRDLLDDAARHRRVPRRRSGERRSQRRR